MNRTRNARLKMLHTVILKGEHDSPVMAWSKRLGQWYLEVSTAGWSTERLARYGLTVVRELPFSDLYDLVAVQN